MKSAGFPAALLAEPFCYVTTTGRRTGREHTIEIWFGASGSTLYLLAGGRERADWVRNAQADNRVLVTVGELDVPATARVVDPGTPEDGLARRLLLEKYRAPGSTDLEQWGRSALPVALDLDVSLTPPAPHDR